MQVKEFHVTGMTCGHCVASVEKELSAVPGVTGVSVDLVPAGRSKVTVTGNPLPVDADVIDAVERAGYEVA